jgi:hypothetical protein
MGSQDPDPDSQLNLQSGSEFTIWIRIYNPDPNSQSEYEFTIRNQIQGKNNQKK